MHKWRFTDSKGNEWERITKKQARAAYNNGLTVVFCPVNSRPFGAWGLEMEINRENINCNFSSFETILNEFEWYNCRPDTGKYTAFYIPIETYKGV